MIAELVFAIIAVSFFAALIRETILRVRAHEQRHTQALQLLAVTEILRARQHAAARPLETAVLASTSQAG